MTQTVSLIDAATLTEEEKRAIHSRPGESFHGLLEELATAARDKALRAVAEWFWVRSGDEEHQEWDYIRQWGYADACKELERCIESPGIPNTKGE